MTHAPPPVGKHLLAAVTVFATLAAGGAARADARLERLIRDVQAYDVTGDRTLDALRRLAPYAEWSPSPLQQLEVALLRASASIDLLLIAGLTGDDKLRERLAEAHGVPPTQLTAHLDALLDKADRPPLQGRVRQARSLLAMLTHGTEPDAAALRTAHGGSAEIVWLLTLSRRLEAGEAAETALADLSEDPCAGGDSCEERLRPFDAAGRRALAGLERAARVAREVADAQAPAPLVVALRDKLRPAARRVRGLRFVPSLRLDGGPPCSRAAAGGRAETPEVLAFVSPGELRVAFAPQAQLDAAGHVVLRSAGEPRFPETRAVKLPGTYPGYLRRITSASEAFAQLSSADRPLSLGLCPSPDTPAHVWARAVLSARHAGFERPLLLAVGDDGGSRSLDVDVVVARRADRVGHKELSVMVRIGGYSVRRGHSSTTIPRVTTKDGLRFDLDGLLRHAQPAEVASAKLHFMPDVASSTLLSTAFAIAPRGERLTVILP